MLREEFLADSWLVVKTVQRRFRRDLHQVAIAFLVFGQDQKMVVGIAIRRRAFDAMIVLLADVQLAADDGLNSGGLGGIHEVHGAKNIAMVGHSHGRHAQLFYAPTQLVYVTSAVEHGVVSMKM